MRRINEHDINRIVKKILLERNDIKINGVNVSIDNTYDSKIYVGDFAFWVTARTCSIFDKEDCDNFENAHIKSFVKTSDGGLNIETIKNSIPLDKSQVEYLFDRLRKGEMEVKHKDTFFGVPFEVRFQR